MNLLYRYLILVLIVSGVFGCKKGQNNYAQPGGSDIVYPSYSALKTGNYWVYRIYTLDSNYAIIDSITQTDSAYVEKDTTINGNTYYKYWIPQNAGASYSGYTGAYRRAFLRQGANRS